MWLRRAFFWWMIPAAFVLPVWLLVGWAAFNAGGWAFLWVLFLAIPGVFLWQLLLTLLVRARGTVRAHRAVSWWDVLGFSVWHLLVLSLGFFNQAWWAPVMVVTVLVGIGVFWLALWQLWREAKPSRIVMHTVDGVAYLPPMQERPEGVVQDVIIVNEKQGRSAP
ncbi:MFS transporter permease [Microbacterium sp. CFBP9034]|uniref:MFS transporter permease n=1 Tax=Microbacterium sp. CFBP9034 TaxID=3096540 RepID=UPI002A6B46D2|nr:MFS transporter permease [Microbacterium sp. CFBP9034]MDY0909502.1 MFS transporter permease [Microbacterium sp. CFBP9034]